MNLVINFYRENLQEYKLTWWRRLFFPSYENMVPITKLKVSISKTKGSEGFTWIKSGVAMKEVFKGWNALSTSNPQEKGWSFLVNWVKGVTSE